MFSLLTVLEVVPYVLIFSFFFLSRKKEGGISNAWSYFFCQIYNSTNTFGMLLSSMDFLLKMDITLSM